MSRDPFDCDGAEQSGRAVIDAVTEGGNAHQAGVRKADLLLATTARISVSVTTASNQVADLGYLTQIIVWCEVYHPPLSMITKAPSIIAIMYDNQYDTRAKTLVP